MTVTLPPRSRPLLRRYITRPWTAAARTSPAARRWLDQHGYITPHFTWPSYACTDGTPVPKSLRGNAVRLHWRLELMRHRLGDVAMTVDGPYRTCAKNTQVGGASDSRHVHADAADFFKSQVDRWAEHIRKRSETLGQARTRVVAIASRTFYNGGVGNENSGTLHVDARGVRARFVTWIGSR
jgi:hypothetical protein